MVEFASVPIVLALLAFGLRLWGSRQIAAKQLADELDEERCRLWFCPQCGSQYRSSSQFIRYGAGDNRHCLFVCKDCQYLSVFDKAGQSLYGGPFENTEAVA